MTKLAYLSQTPQLCSLGFLSRPSFTLLSLSLPLHHRFLYQPPFHPISPVRVRPFFLSSKSFSVRSAMDSSAVSPSKEFPTSQDLNTEEEYASQSKLLQEFINISTVDKAWPFSSGNGSGSQTMFLISQPNLLANKQRKYILSSHNSKGNDGSMSFQWAPFPIEVTGASAILPSPSGSKLLVIRNSENDSPTQFEIWSSSHLEKELLVPQSIHGSVYVDGWFEGISWNHNESLIAYVAEEQKPSQPMFNASGFNREDSKDKDCGSWKAQGDWEDHWGETYAGKRKPALFVINIHNGEVWPIQRTSKSLSVGQVVWAPSTGDSHQYLVFVGWSSDARKLGIKYCYNRPCSLYAVKAPFHGSRGDMLQTDVDAAEEVNMHNLTQSIGSAFFPRFSPDGKFLVFMSAKTSVDSGVHCATNSLHRVDWPTDGELNPSAKVVDVVPVVNCPEDDCFPGLYCSNILRKPWLSDGCTMILSTIWGSTVAIISVNVLSGNVSRISPNSKFSWDVLTVDGDDIVAVCSSPINVPQVKYGCLVREASSSAVWSWLDVSGPLFKSSEKVRSLLLLLQFNIMRIPVRNFPENLTKGASKPFEAIFVSSLKKQGACDPLIVILHGGPHSVSVASFSKSLAFLSSIGHSLLIVNYRGSLGFGEEALQSLPGKVGSQDVNDVLTAIDHVIDLGFADPSKITVFGGSHGGFLTAHLIGQAPDKFVAAAVRNPVCNLALMVGTTDIPDWCYVEAYGHDGKSKFTDAPSIETLAVLYSKSPISHLHKIKTPTLILLGAQDLRVPVSNGLHYARALKESGVEVKLIVFPNDVHAIDRPQSDFESFLNIGVWFKKYCK